jgi:hypothetical protein
MGCRYGFPRAASMGCLDHMAAIDPTSLGNAIVQLASAADSLRTHPPMPVAYIDPGTGSLLIQAALAAMLTIPFLIRRRIAGGIDWLLRKVGRRRPPPDDTTPQA